MCTLSVHASFISIVELLISFCSNTCAQLISCDACDYIRVQNNDLSQVIIQPTLAYDQANSNLVEQILIYALTPEML